MRKYFVLLVMLAWSVTGFTTIWVDINNNTPVPAGIRVVSSGLDRSTIRLNLDGFNLREVQTPNGPAYCV